MGNGSKKFKLKTPTSTYLPIILNFPILLLLLASTFTGRGVYSSIPLPFRAIFTVLLLAVFIACGIRVYIQPRHLELTADKMILSHKEVPVSRIDKIIIQGYFVQSIGIKVHGKRLVPSLLHFRFKEDEETHVNELKLWAQEHGIVLKYGKIYRWI